MTKAITLLTLAKYARFIYLVSSLRSYMSETAMIAHGTSIITDPLCKGSKRGSSYVSELNIF